MGGGALHRPRMGGEVEAAWYVINNLLAPVSLTASSLCCVTTVFLIKLLQEGVFHPNRSIFYISWQLNCRQTSKQSGTNKLKEWRRRLTCIPPVCCTSRAPGCILACRWLLGKGTRERQVWVSSCSKPVTESSFQQLFFLKINCNSFQVLVLHLVLQVVKSLKSNFRRFLVCEKASSENWRCLQKWRLFKHSLNSCKATLDMNFSELPECFRKGK